MTKCYYYQLIKWLIGWLLTFFFFFVIFRCSFSVWALDIRFEVRKSINSMTISFINKLIVYFWLAVDWFKKRTIILFCFSMFFVLFRLLLLFFFLVPVLLRLKMKHLALVHTELPIYFPHIHRHKMAIKRKWKTHKNDDLLLPVCSLLLSMRTRALDEN